LHKLDAIEFAAEIGGRAVAIGLRCLLEFKERNVDRLNRAGQLAGKNTCDTACFRYGSTDGIFAELENRQRHRAG
jgi:hypothetical protein